MDKNSIQNYENVKKLTKYQIRLAGADTDKRNTYGYKVKEYSGKLDGNGINSKKILATIQSGGNPFAELEAQQKALRDSIAGLTAKVDRTVLERQITDITASAGRAAGKYNDIHGKYDTLAKEYGKFAGTSIVGNYDIQNRLKGVKLESNPALSDDEMGAITTAMTIDDKADADVDAIVKGFLVETHLAELDKDDGPMNLARSLVGKKFGTDVNASAAELKKLLIDQAADPAKNDAINAAVDAGVAAVANL
jgi:hypothetical protein